MGRAMGKAARFRFPGATNGLNATEAQAARRNEPRPLPAQALDHATGYLMAFGAMTALIRTWLCAIASTNAHRASAS
jgi:hypothetical protein